MVKNFNFKKILIKFNYLTIEVTNIKFDVIKLIKINTFEQCAAILIIFTGFFLTIKFYQFLQKH